MSWGRRRSTGAKALGWQDVSGADFTLWVDEATPDQRKHLADLVEQTLVTVVGHEPSELPVVTPP